MKTNLLYKLKLTTTLLVVLSSLLTFQSFAGDIKDATWYLSIDTDQIRNNQIYNVLKQQGMSNSDDKSFSLKTENLPEEISYITIYGDAKETQEATILLRGDFSSFSISDYVLNFLYTKNDISQLVKDKTLDYHGHKITIMTINEDHHQKNGETKEIYFSKITNNLSVVSLKRGEVNNWIDNKYKDVDLSNGSLFSVVVNVQSAMAHLGMNIDKNDNFLHSQILNKVSQVSASVNEISGEMHVDVALSTNDEATANQIITVVNGLVAMSNLSNESHDETLTVLVKNLTIVQEGNNVLLNTFIVIDELEKLHSN